MTYQSRKQGIEQWFDLEMVDETSLRMRQGFEYRVKPQPAAPKWPQTTMTKDDLWSQIDNVRNAPALEVFANMVIARSCEDGHVVPADKVREIEAKAYAHGSETVERDPERDLKIARAIQSRMQVSSCFDDELLLLIDEATK